MRAVDCGRSKSVKAVRAYVCFLEREVYAFLSTFDKRGERVRGAMPRARIFCLWEGRRKQRERQAMDRPQMGRWRHVRMAAGRATQEERCVREKGRKMFFFFLGERIRRCFLCLLGSDSSRGAAIAALWYRHRRENVADCGLATQLVEGCGLWPPNPAYPAYRP